MPTQFKISHSSYWFSGLWKQFQFVFIGCLRWPLESWRGITIAIQKGAENISPNEKYCFIENSLRFLICSSLRSRRRNPSPFTTLIRLLKKRYFYLTFFQYEWKMQFIAEIKWNQLLTTYSYLTRCQCIWLHN